MECGNICWLEPKVVLEIHVAYSRNDYYKTWSSSGL